MWGGEMILTVLWVTRHILSHQLDIQGLPSWTLFYPIAPAKRLFYVIHKISESANLNPAGSVWVVFWPCITILLKHVLIDCLFVLFHCLEVSTKDKGYKNVYNHQPDDQDEGEEVNLRHIQCATANRFVPSVYVVLISWILNALEVHTIRRSKCIHEIVPIFTGSAP